MGTRAIRLLKRCAGDRAGATAVEFAIVAPVFLTLLLGVFDYGHMIYAQSVLQGAVHQAGRNSGLESGSDFMDAIDDDVRGQVHNIVPQGSVLTSRTNYESFNDVNKPEDFVDANANGNWDEDRGLEGLGGADDVVLYTATLEYDRLVPMFAFVGGSEQHRISASTILRNQPFGDQAERPEEQICPE